MFSKKAKFFLIILIPAMIFVGCKKDKEEVEPDTARIEYDGNYYILDRGLIWDYAPTLYRQPLHP